MGDNIIIAVGEFLATLLVLLKPIIDLNSNITALKLSIDQFKESINKLDDRITEHGKELDKINVTLANHEARISALEK